MSGFRYLYYFHHPDLSIVETKKDLPDEALPEDKYKWLVIPHDSNIIWPLKFHAQSQAGNKEFRTFAEAELTFDEKEGIVTLMGREFKFERKNVSEIPLDLQARISNFLKA